MRPIRLVLDGFLSYGKRQEIDFSRLLNTGIFIIQGETGSGKSSIIDAITFALYGRIPRFNKETRKDLFINYNCSKCLVDYEFKIRDTSGKNKIYRIIRMIPRNGTGEVEIRERDENDTLKRKYRLNLRDSADYISNKIIGLPYESFIRTIVLPQGKFSEFLLSTPSQKAEIILKISGIDEIYSFIKENVSKSIKHIQLSEQSYQQRLEELKNISEVDIQKNQNKIKQIDLDIKRQSAKLLDIEREIQNIDRNSLEIETVISKIRTFEQNVEEKRKIEKLVEDKKEEKKSYEKSIEQIKQKTEIIKEVYEKTNEIETEIKNLSEIRLDEIKTDIQDLLSKSVELQRKTELRDKKTKEISDLKKDLEKIYEQKNKFPDIQKTRKIRNHIEQLSDIIKQKKMTNERIKELKDDISSKEKRIKQLETEREEKNQELSELKKRISELENQIESERLKEMSSEIRKSLKDGDICPVCGNVFREKTHTTPDDVFFLIVKDKPPLETKIKNLQSELEKQRKEEDKLKKELGMIMGEIESTGREIQKLKNQMKSKEDELRYLDESENQICRFILDEIGGSEIENFKQIEGKINQDPFEETYTFEGDTSQIIEDLIKLEDIFSTYEKDIEKIKSKISALSKSLDETEQDIKEIQNRIDGIKDKLPSHKQNIYRTKALTENIRNSIQEIIDKIEKKHISEHANEVARKIKSELSDLVETSDKMLKILHYNEIFKNNDLKNIQESLKNITEAYELKISLVNKANEFTRKIEKSLKKYEDDIKEKENDKNKISNEILVYESRIKDIEENLKSMESEILQILQNQSVTCDISKAKFELEKKLKENLNIRNEMEMRKNELNDYIRKMSEEKGSIKREIEEIIKKIEEKKEIETRIQEIKNEYSVLSYIYDDFSSSGKSSLKNYITWYFTKKIVEYGGRILKDISSGRYSFKMSQDGNIRIIDSLYSDREREPESLSGGEIFISSLALALSLSMSLTGKSKFECFFIDEGFGSLDQDSLETVINSLERLAGEGLNLGIISHVDNMKKTEYFAKLMVSKDKQTGYSIVNIKEKISEN
ncbi:MAG: SMC family ATPase [Candidatus Calescibacterium sp.]|nr:SMC family ATPase [Candidatus Calescibacterium sp.]MCX7733250.1 SMC family ATPase [bacterium]MDW8086957.1 SMC family ATPase [Candidatus Calescibacterium sp.]